ncbi:hypothetical protein SPRG_15524 [Saprolegnia parasitica CBS 223.65]|uniref:Spondin-like TSP1 domain-containing protein n=1 Tax=Saprolegnia parasitica (strain CBS 223.65) TaxID=695850 RepID=A0A067BXN0_SAPPC|nr:hypothetical protein SPRG_15524 [Saprolegnia parasitica CBS 223.65]KDO19322.1 hypothetical protein SPRG_15524 [Saprolegnia parasitica CBS 223.65]|eukprot:XP_012209965.1 hypothetical protein SPRG_15524 [Saprolegnia parasitica CBS 223.65]
MRLSLSLATIALAHYVSAAAYDPSQLRGISDPVLIAKIEGYMPPICSKLYGDEKHWSPWSNCSAECGLGEQVRYLNGIGQKNAVTNGCEIQQDKQACHGTLCPQDCLYSDFTAWSTCDATTGTQVRSRSETTLALNGGKDCPTLWGPPTETRDCNIDCDGSWEEWTECSGTSATQSRSYSVSQYPRNNGKSCPALQTQDCNPACGSVAWGPYSTCDPVSGTYTRTRHVPVDANFVRLTVALRQNQCATVDTQACNIDCKLGEWTPSGACDAMTGTQAFKREVLQKEINCGKPCDSVAHNTALTKSEPCAVHCQVSAWSDWVCNPSTGESTRSRSITQNPKNGGSDCGELQQTRDCRCTGDVCPEPCETGDWTQGKCSPDSCTLVSETTMVYPIRDAGKVCNLYKTEPCTLDAVMGPWGDWGACDATAHQTRTREIVNAACNGGQAAGPTSEKRSCQEICDHAHNPWGEWSVCDQTTATQTRSRAIVNPPTADQEPCATSQVRDCAVDCVMDNWGEWSECDECTGLQVHNRKVLIPMQNGGNQCPPTQETQTCAVTCMASEWTPWSAPDDSCTCSRTRTEIAPAINGGTCQLTDTDPTCTQNCQVSDWSVPDECILSGAHAGKQRSTRSITTKHCNGGAQCPDDLERYTDCNVDCVLSDWSEWSSCDLKTQQQTRTRSVLQQSYNGGAACGTLVDYQGCGSCADIVSDFSYSECDATTGLRTGTATYLYPPQNGLACNLVVQDTCAVHCVLSEWSAGQCNVQGELAGKVVSTRSILTPPLNGGRKCEDLTKHDKCVVDCMPGDTWGAWSDCSAQGFSRRVINVLYPAQNGGRNDECLVEEQKTCAVDCAIDPVSGEITQPSLNGGMTCHEFANANNIPGSYPDYSTTSSISFMTMLASNKSYALAAAASGGVGVMFLVGFFTTRQRRGYNSISGQAL